MWIEALLFGVGVVAFVLTPWVIVLSGLAVVDAWRRHKERR